MREASGIPLQTELERASRGEHSVRASVIIVNYNGGELVRRCVHSILQHIGPDDEVILVDNASTDGSLEAVRSAFPDVTVIRSYENVGFGEGNNAGVRAASGEFLAFLNPDTIVESDWITPLLAPLMSDPAVGMTTSRILLLDDPARVNTCGNDVHISGITMCRGMGKPGNLYREQEWIGAVSGAAFSMRRSLFDDLGGFDGAFFLYMEDTDLSLRARLAGYQVQYVPGSVILHRYALKFSNRKVYYQERNRYRMLLKVMGWRTLAALLPVFAAAEVVTWAFVLLKMPGQAVDKLRAYYWIATSGPDVLAQRRRVQSTRIVTDRELLSACSWRVNFAQVESSTSTRLAETLVNPVVQAISRFSYALVR